MRPQSLVAAGDSFDRCLANFLDAFYVAPEAAELSEPPPLPAPSEPVTGPVWDAYLAATAKQFGALPSSCQPVPVDCHFTLACSR